MGRDKSDRTQDNFGLGLLTLAFGLVCFFVVLGFPTTILSTKGVLAGFIFIGIAAIALSVLRQRSKDHFNEDSASRRNDFKDRLDNLHLDTSPKDTVERKSPPPIPAAPREKTGDKQDDSRWSGIAQSVPWSIDRIEEQMRKIDWYQFEKFCAAVLESEGFIVERTGGAKADGGVDLTASKDGVRTLIQCKQWRTWKIKLGTVREMLGSMTHLSVDSGAIYSLNSATKPAMNFAKKHGISFVTSKDLAQRARTSLVDKDLDRFLDSSTHQCPRCDAEMVLKTGDFKPFWGCSTFPRTRCRGRFEHLESA